LEKTLSIHRPVIVCEISYGNELSFKSLDDLLGALPDNYSLMRFNTRNTDGSKAKKRGSKAKRTGEYRVVSLKDWRESGQDDVIAVPGEKLSLIPGYSR